MIGYLVLPYMQIDNLNTEGSFFTTGVPATTAITGFAHSLERKHFGELPIKVSGTAVYFHWLSQARGDILSVSYQSDVKNSDIGKNSPMMGFRSSADAAVTLVLRIDAKDGVPAHRIRSQVKTWLSQEDNTLEQAIGTENFAGGFVHDRRSHAFVASDSELIDLLKRLPKGNFLVDRCALLESSEPQADALTRLLDLLTKEGVTDAEGKTHWSSIAPGWLVPLSVGFFAIETPKSRSALRQPLPHCYAEPALGLGEFIALRRVISQQAETPQLNDTPIFWDFHVNPAVGAYLAVADQPAV